MKERGPVFVTSFSPLCTVITAALSSIFLADKVHVGRYNTSPVCFVCVLLYNDAFMVAV